MPEEFLSPFSDPLGYARRLLEQESVETPAVPVQPAPVDPSAEEPDEEFVRPEPASDELVPPEISASQSVWVSEPSIPSEPDRPAPSPPQVQELGFLPIPESTSPPEPERSTTEPQMEPTPSLPILPPALGPERERRISEPELSGNPERPIVSDWTPEPEPERPFTEPNIVAVPRLDVPIPELESNPDRNIPQQSEYTEPRRDVATPDQNEYSLLETRFESNNPPSPVERRSPSFPSIDEVFASMDASPGGVDNTPQRSETQHQIDRDAQIFEMIERNMIIKNMGGA